MKLATPTVTIGIATFTNIQKVRKKNINMISIVDIIFSNFLSSPNMSFIILCERIKLLLPLLLEESLPKIDKHPITSIKINQLRCCWTRKNHMNHI